MMPCASDHAARYNKRFAFARYACPTCKSEALSLAAYA